MTAEELEALREDWDFEAKKAGGKDGQGALPASLWETYSAMANTHGGLILLGAQERHDGSLTPTGIASIDQVEKDLWNTLQNPQKVSANLLTRGDVERINLGGKTLLLLRVPKARRSQLPVHLNQSIDRGTYVRVYEGDRLVSPAVAHCLLADSFHDGDSRAVSEYTLDDIDPESVARFRSMLSASRPTHPFLAKEGANFLLAIGAVARDQEQALRPTWAGMWMLGNEISLRQLLPHWHLSFKELPSDPADTRRWEDRVHPDGTWNANLFAFYMRAVNKITAGLKVPFALNEEQFRVDETEAHKALREALVNALVHADHRGYRNPRDQRPHGCGVHQSGIALDQAGTTLAGRDQRGTQSRFAAAFRAPATGRTRGFGWTNHARCLGKATISRSPSVGRCRAHGDPFAVAH